MSTISKTNPDLTALLDTEGGVILFDKPLGWSSFKVIHEIRKRLGVKKAGHAGTLDPKATGLLIVCSNKKTKVIDNFQGLDKEYTGIFRLGQRTPSMDTETQVIEERPYEHISELEILSATKQFTGTIEQVPPMYSACSFEGKKLYTLARKGKTIERKARTITISEFEITRIELPYIHFRVQCTKGTYIRVLAEDLGNFLGCGAYLAKLRRTKIGTFSVDDAFTADVLFAGADYKKEEQGVPVFE